MLTLSFYAPDWVNSNETAGFTLTFDVGAGISDFDLTQVATAPIPAGAWLLESALLRNGDSIK